MTVLDSIRDFFRREQCTKLILWDSKNLTVKSLSADLPLVKIGIGEIDSSATVLRQAGDAATALDDFQFLLCQQLKSLPHQDPSRGRITEIRTQGILWITALRMALAAYAQNPAGEGETLANIANEATKRLMMAASPTLLGRTEPIYGAPWTKSTKTPAGQKRGAAAPRPAPAPDLRPSDLVLKLTNTEPEDVAKLTADLAAI